MSNQKLLEQIDSQTDYVFNTDKITYSSIGLKGEKQSYVTGYISVPEIDLYDDLVTPAALKSMLKQITETTITLDYEHEAFRDDATILPVGKIVEARVDERGLWVKAQLNSHSPKYKALWGSIKEGFVNAFSIAFKPLKTVEKAVGDTTVRLIEELKLLNVALTANPVNQGARMTGHSMKAVMLKAIDDTQEEKVLVSKALLTKLMEDINMETKDEPKVEEAVEEPVEAVEEAKEELVEEAVEEPAEEAAEEPAEEPAPEAEEAPEVEQKALAELKAKVEAQEKELKSLKEKSVFKSTLSDKPVEAVEQKAVNMMDLI